MRWTIPHPILAAFLIAVFAARSVAQDHRDCLDKVYAKGASASAERDFDLLFDSVTGASFSCYLYTAASKVRDALESFRCGVLYRDKKSLDRVVKYPLNVVLDKTGDPKQRRTITVRGFQDWLTMQNAEMTKEQVAAIQCSWLGNVEMVGGQSFNPGFTIANGLVFWRTDPSDVRVTNVDLFPISRETLGRYCTP